MYLLKARNELPWAAMITFLPSNNLGAIWSSQKGATRGSKGHVMPPIPRLVLIHSGHLDDKIIR